MGRFASEGLRPTLHSFPSLKDAISFVRLLFLTPVDVKRVAVPGIVAEVTGKIIGYKEVQLIGQNVNSYRPKSVEGLDGYQGATPFSRLIRAVADTGMERIKFTTSFPRDFHPYIVSALEEYSNLCDWIHLPVQSGSNRILKAMRRGHNSDDYLRRVDGIKNSRRRLSLTSDIIVGFPGESEEDFETLCGSQCEFEDLHFRASESKTERGSQPGGGS